ncbi:MAG: 8-amino-7-oxononanoate synthase, partial [Planctomycetales bacterium]
MDPLEWMNDELSALDAQGLRRTRTVREGPQAVRIRVGGKEFLNFSSNDYLGLASDPRIQQAVRDSVGEEGVGAGASPLVLGRGQAQRRLEEEIAAFEGTPAAMIFPSGFAANLGTIAALVGPGDCVFGDKLNHASMIDGCRLSGARFRAYRHADMDRLESLLKKSSDSRRRLIVTDGLFSMDGDFAPLRAAADLAQRYDAMLLVDEAHATGVLGAAGRGTAELLGVEEHVHVRVGTLSKALGCVGGFVAGSQALIDWLVNRARSWVFSTALPGVNCVAAETALRIVREEPERRKRLIDRASQLRTALVERGWNIGGSQSQIIPVVVGESERATRLAERLKSRGIWAPSIRPPSVPPRGARVRLSVRADHTEEMIDAAASAMGRAED